jgi:hypothetical protein
MFRVINEDDVSLLNDDDMSLVDEGDGVHLGMAPFAADVDTVLDCFETAEGIFSSKIEGSFIQVLKNTIEFKTVTKFRGKVNFIRRYDNTSALDYDISFEIRFEAFVDRKYYLGLCSVESLTTSDIPNCDMLKVVWYGNNVPVGSLYQQCDSLIKTFKVRKCLIERLKLYEDSCVETFNRRYGWGQIVVDMPEPATGRRSSRRSSNKSKLSSHGSGISLS